MYRSHTCGELNITHVQQEVTLSGWVQTIRKFGAITFVDLRDRYGITQLLFGESLNEQLDTTPLGREFVLQVKGLVSERSSKNKNIRLGRLKFWFRNLPYSINLRYHLLPFKMTLMAVKTCA